MSTVGVRQPKLEQSGRVPPRKLLLEKGTLYVNLALSSPNWSDEELPHFMTKNSILIERPASSLEQSWGSCNQ